MSVDGKQAPRPKAGGKRRRRRVLGRGILWLIALAFAASGLLRLGGETGQAIAREVAALAANTARDGDGAADLAEACGSEADIAEVLARLREREARLERREAALEDRLQALSVADLQIRRNMAALVEAEAELEATMALADTAAEDDLVRLTSVYENMKPKDAAPLFATMDPQFAAGFLGRMRADAAAAIMAGLDPQAAYSISVILAGRNANVPTR